MFTGCGGHGDRVKPAVPDVRDRDVPFESQGKTRSNLSTLSPAVCQPPWQASLWLCHMGSFGAYLWHDDLPLIPS